MKFVLAAVAAAAVLSTPALADELEPYSEVPGWTIMVDTTLNNGCVAIAEFTDNSTVRIGFDMLNGGGYITSFNPAWVGIEEGTSYPVTISLDDETFEGNATGMILDDVPGADVVFDNVEFFVGLATHQTLALSHDGTQVMKIDLAGSSDAMNELVACQDAQKG